MVRIFIFFKICINLFLTETKPLIIDYGIIDSLYLFIDTSKEYDFILKYKVLKS